jgi:hypothetical protein
MLLLKRTKPIPRGHTTALLMAAIFAEFDNVTCPAGSRFMTLQEKAKCAIILWALDRPGGVLINELITFEEQYGEPSQHVANALARAQYLTYDPEEEIETHGSFELFTRIKPFIEEIETAMKQDLRFYPWQAVMRVIQVLDPVKH